MEGSRVLADNISDDIEGRAQIIARQMAAAPELLVALCGLVQFAQNALLDPLHPTTRAIAERAITLAYNAINKATNND